MSSGSKISLYAIQETVPGETPTTGTWFIVQRVTDGLTENVTTTQSEIVKDTRFRQGSFAVQSELSGDLESELSIGTFDLFFASLAMNDWASDVLEFGGSLRKTWTFIKVFEDIGIIRAYRGIAFNTGTLSITNGEKVTTSFNLIGTGYEQLDTSPVTSPVDMMTTPLVSSLNVKDFLIDGQGVVGTACLQSLELEITNNLEAIYCIGNQKMTAEKYIEKMVDITLTTQFMFSGQVADYSDRIKSGARTSISFGIEDAKGNAYEFSFPELEVSEAPHPDAGGEDLVMQDITFAHVQVSPTITRTIAVPVTGVTVSPTTATLTTAGETKQLSKTIAPPTATVTDVAWSSDKPNIATVSNTGLVTAVANGTAIITAKTIDGDKTATCTVTVNIP